MTPADILENAARAAQGSIGLALLWHVALLAAAIALGRGWRPSRRSAGLALSAPLLSVSAVAWAHGNPFNGGVFLVAAAILGAIVLRLPTGLVSAGPRWACVAGVILIVLGFFYPHFLESRSPWLYLVAAPLGVLPCPTLCAVAGFSLLSNALGSRAWSSALGVLALFYGAFGAFRLGVQIDLVLGAGALSLLGLSAAVQKPRPASSWRISS